MQKKITFSVFIVALMAAILFPFCDGPEVTLKPEPNKITLIWNKSYEGQTAGGVKRGLIWTLSWLGAELPEGSFDKAIESKDSTEFTINLDSVGFNESACNALRVICDSIKRSGEYKTYGGIDIGKFVMLTLGSSWHYYEITGAPKTLDEFKTKYRIDTSAYLFGVTKSTIAEGHRRIRFSRDTSLWHLGFYAEEGDGLLVDGTFKTRMYECFDIMPNGQLRFMIYDLNGNLASGTPLEVGDAGKPTKCLWCHETSVQPLFIDNEPVAGMLTNEEFLAIRDSVQNRLQRYRFALKSDMNYEHHPEHTLAELLYITYMEPSLTHLEQEWKMSEPDVKARLKNESPYRFEEFDYIGMVYKRTAIDALDTIFNLEVPVSARETGREVNYFK